MTPRGTLISHGGRHIAAFRRHSHSYSHTYHHSGTPGHNAVGGTAGVVILVVFVVAALAVLAIAKSRGGGPN
jgi:hypothetical protein